MGLLLSTKSAEHPFYYEKLDLDLWSIQELSYVICQYPVILPEDFVDKKLIAWIRDELGLELLAGRLLQMQQSGEPLEMLLTAILLEGNYYTSAEVSRFKNEFRRLHDAEPEAFAELLGDTFFRMGRFSRAVSAYEDARAAGAGEQTAEKLAAAYVRVMQFDRAAVLYEEVYKKTGSEQALKRLYYIGKLEPSIRQAARYAGKAGEQKLAAWEQDFLQARAAADSSERVKRIDEVFAREPEARRKAVAELIGSWKREYRERA